MRTKLTSKELFQKVNQGGIALNGVVTELYTDKDIKGQVLKFVRYNGGQISDAEDVLHEGIRNLIMNVRAGKFSGAGSLKAYLLVICKNIWKSQFSRNVHLKHIKTEVDSPTTDNETPEHHFLWKDRAAQIEQVLTRIGESCKEILGLWSLGYSFKEIGLKSNRNEGAARKQKHVCFKKLMLFLKNNPQVMDELRELKSN